MAAAALHHRGVADEIAGAASGERKGQRSGRSGPLRGLVRVRCARRRRWCARRRGLLPFRSPRPISRYERARRIGGSTPDAIRTAKRLASDLAYRRSALHFRFPRTPPWAHQRSVDAAKLWRRGHGREAGEHSRQSIDARTALRSARRPHRRSRFPGGRCRRSRAAALLKVLATGAGEGGRARGPSGLHMAVGGKHFAPMRRRGSTLASLASPVSPPAAWRTVKPPRDFRRSLRRDRRSGTSSRSRARRSSKQKATLAGLTRMPRLTAVWYLRTKAPMSGTQQCPAMMGKPGPRQHIAATAKVVRARWEGSDANPESRHRDPRGIAARRKSARENPSTAS